jgi:hypothetical protein
MRLSVAGGSLQSPVNSLQSAVTISIPLFCTTVGVTLAVIRNQLFADATHTVKICLFIRNQSEIISAMKNIFFIRRSLFPLLLFTLSPFLLLTLSLKAQDATDLFRPDVPLTWLGIDFSHCQFTGNFAEFAEAGRKSSWQLRDVYFPKWNLIVLEEPEKYDIRGMFRKEAVQFEIGMITSLNAKTPLDSMETFNAVQYSDEQVTQFVSRYDLAGKQGIGLVLIAESFNKFSNEALYHLVAIDMGTGKIVLHKKMRGEPKGIGLRNYWANSFARVIQYVRDYYYWEWKKENVNNLNSLTTNGSKI